MCPHPESSRPPASTVPHPLPSGNHHTAVCVHEYQFYTPPVSEIIWFLAFSDLFCSAWYSQGPPTLSQWQCFIYSHGWVVLRRIYAPHLLYPALCQRALCLHVVATMNNAALNSGVHISLQINVFKFSGYTPRRGIPGSNGNSILRFLGNSRLFSTVAVPVYLPTSSEWGFPFLHNLSNTC